MALVDCRSCYGTKKVPCMGGMRKKCEACCGTGKAEKVEPAQTLPPTIKNKKPRRKAVQLDMTTEVNSYE
jgi:hypothetical protein